MAGKIRHKERSRKTRNKDAAGKTQFFYLTQVKTQIFRPFSLLEELLMKKER